MNADKVAQLKEWSGAETKCSCGLGMPFDDFHAIGCNAAEHKWKVVIGELIGALEAAQRERERLNDLADLLLKHKLDAEARLSSLREKARAVANRLELNGPRACTCKLEGFVGGPIPCVTCQAKKELAALASELEKG